MGRELTFPSEKKMVIEELDKLRNFLWSYIYNHPGMEHEKMMEAFEIAYLTFLVDS